MFNVESTKECMSFFLLLDPIFHLWETNLVEWENCNILDNIGDMSTCPPMLIKKINIWLPFEFERKEIGKDGSRSSCKNNPICDRPAKGGGQHHLKSMCKCSKQLKN